MTNTNFHVTFFFYSISKMEKILPPSRQNHFSSRSVKTRIKSSFLPRNPNYSLFHNGGNVILVLVLSSCFLKNFIAVLAIENTQDIELHPLIILAESPEHLGPSNSNADKQKELPTSSSTKTKREGRQFDYETSTNQQRSSVPSQQQSPQDLVSGSNYLK